MKSKPSLRVAALAAIVLSAVSMPALRAQAPAVPPATATPPAFYISEFELTDADDIRPYSARVDATFAPFGGRYLVRGGKSDAREGQPAKCIVMIGFPSLAQAQAWYDSPAYREIMPIRHRSATTRVYIVEGMPAR